MHPRQMFLFIVMSTACQSLLPTRDGIATDPSSAPHDTSVYQKSESEQTTPFDDASHTSRCGYTAPDRVIDGDFESPPMPCGWNVFDATTWGVMVTPYCNLPDHDGCVMYLASGGRGSNSMAQFSQELALAPETRYVLSFETRGAGEDPRPFVTYMLGTQPNHGLGDGVHMASETDWHAYEFSFTTDAHPENNLLDFAFGNADTGLYLDNISVVPVAESSNVSE